MVTNLHYLLLISMCTEDVNTRFNHVIPVPVTCASDTRHGSSRREEFALNSEPHEMLLNIRTQSRKTHCQPQRLEFYSVQITLLYRNVLIVV